MANMEQVGSKDRARHVAARRAGASGIVKIQDINGRMAGVNYPQANERSSRNWELKEPDLPEKMIISGEMTIDEFPASTRPFLKFND